MNIKEELLKNKIHLKKDALRISKYAVESPKHFKELMKCFLSNEYRLAQRAAWSVSWAAQQKPEMITPHIKSLVAVLEKNNVHPAVHRNSVRVLQQIEIPEKFHGELMNSCFRFIENPQTPVAIKVFSLTTLYNLSKYYPDIKPELKTLIEDLLPTETAAFASRGKKILIQLNKK